MYFARIPEDESPEDFEEIKADGMTFYTRRSPANPNKKTPKRRYSDQFNDPLFVAKDTFRKLNMIRRFKRKYKDIDAETRKFVECIEESISILNKEFFVEPKTIFEAFNLRQLGIDPEDFGVGEAEIVAED